MNVIYNKLAYSSEESMSISGSNGEIDEEIITPGTSSNSSVDFIKLYKDREGIGLFEPSLQRFPFIRKEVQDPKTKFTPISDVRRTHQVGTLFDEAMEGLTMANSKVRFVESDKILFREGHVKSWLTNKVKIISGGKGNWSDFVGKGMLTCAVMGIGGPPKPRVIFVAIRELSKGDHGGTIAIVPSNFEDELNWGIAVAKAQERGMNVVLVPVSDAACTFGSSLPNKCLPGILLYFKIAGAMSEANRSLSEIYNTLWDLSVASVSCHIRDSFFICTDLEGNGGKPMKEASKGEVVKEMIRLLIDPNEEHSLAYEPDSKFLLLVNAYSGNWNFLNSVAVEAVNHLFEKNIPLEKAFAGFYVVHSTFGFSITLLAGVDTDIIRWLGDYTSSVGWTYPGTGCIAKTTPKDHYHFKKNDRICDDTALTILSTLKAIFSQAVQSENILNDIDKKGVYGTKFSSVARLILNGGNH